MLGAGPFGNSEGLSRGARSAGGKDRGVVRFEFEVVESHFDCMAIQRKANGAYLGRL